MARDPFAWLTLHGPLDLPTFGMQPDTGPLAVVALGTHSHHHLLMDPHPQAWVLREDARPIPVEGPLSPAIRRLFGPHRGGHFWEQAAHGMALEFALSECEEAMGGQWPGPGLWTDVQSPILAIWLRDGLAWRQAPGVAPKTLAQLWQGPPPPSFPSIEAQERLGCGLVLLDAPLAPSAHVRLTSQGRAQQDLDLVHAWLREHHHHDQPALHLSVFS